MRFQMCKMVDSPDAELVSRALETCLRTQWNDVAREGSTIVLRGLGPTHRVNRNDKAVFEVRPADEGQTAIEADVTYLASALVGDSSPQNELVQRKLDGIFELVHMDVDLARRRATERESRDGKPRLVSKTIAAYVVETHATAPAVTETVPFQEVESEPEAVMTGQDAYLDPFSKEARYRSENYVAVDSLPAVADPDPGLAYESVSSRVTVEPKLVHRGEDQEQGGDATVRPVPEQRPLPAKDRSAVKIFSALLVFFVMIGAGQQAWLHRNQLRQRMVDWRAEWSDNEPEVTLGGPALTPKQRAAEQLAARVAAAAQAESAAEAAKLAEPDPKKWLANWADALKRQDAGAQAAFYADTVEKYFLRTNVTRAEVMAARQDAIAKRSGAWSLELDDVVVAQQTDSTARVLMVKHIVIDSGNGKVEQRLPTQIRLKRIDGEWRIVSEQTLG